MKPDEKKTEEKQETSEQGDKKEASDIQFLLKSDNEIKDIKGTNINFAEATMKKEEKNIVELNDTNSENKSKNTE